MRKIKSKTETLDLPKKLIAQYVDLQSQLKAMGIVRTNRNVIGEYAEWLCSQLLELTLAPNTVQSGFDATNSKGETFQIKARIVSNLKDSTSFDFKDIPGNFNFLLCVFFSKNFELLGIVSISHSDVLKNVTKYKSRYSFRWNKKTCALFSPIELEIKNVAS